MLDTSSLVYRAFFAIPQSVADPAGQPVNAVHGYLDMTARLIFTRKPHEAVHVYDADWRPAERVRMYAGYKATRRPDPEPLPPQFDILGEVLDAIGAMQAEAVGWEAEDAIGTLTAKRRSGTLTEIVTGDRDLIQLVRDPDVRVLFTVRGVSDLRVLDEAAVIAKYGIPPSRYADFAILRGDPSDGLPGVRGVGEKTALLLVQAYPDLESLVADALAPVSTGRPLKRSVGLRTCIRDAAGYLAAMRHVVPIRTDLEVRTWAGSPSEKRLNGLAKKHRLEAPIRRLRQALGHFLALIGLVASASAAGCRLGAPDAVPRTAFRGLVERENRSWSFTQCESDRARPLVDRTGGPLAEVYVSLAPQRGEPMYVEMVGRPAATSTPTAEAEDDGSLVVLELRHASPVGEAVGCAQPPTAAEVIARGNEPFWSVTVFPDRMLFQEPENLAGLEFPRSTRVEEDDGQVYRSSRKEGTPREIVLTLQEKGCRDSMSGAYFHLTATVELNGRILQGCGAVVFSPEPRQG